MLYTSKALFILLITSNAFSMEYTTAPVGSGQARTCASYIDSRLTHELNQTLIGLTDEHNSTALLDKLVAHYQKQRPQTRFTDYLMQFRTNITKIFRYTNLALKINREIYTPILTAGVQNDALEDAEQDLIEMQADTLTQEVMEREWALESVKCDLEEQLAKIKNIHTWKNYTAQILPVVEQQDEAFEKTTGRVDSQMARIERAIATISSREKIYKINRDAVDFIIQKASKGTLKKTLGKLAPVCSLQNIDSLFKAGNPKKNPILHALCDNQALTPDVFKIVVEFFVQSGHNINEVNGNDESVLYYAQNKPLDSEYLGIIQENGGLALKLKSSFKKPAATTGDQPKKTLRISDDSPDKKEREEQRALTQSMGLL